MIVRVCTVPIQESNISYYKSEYAWIRVSTYVCYNEFLDGLFFKKKEIKHIDNERFANTW